jgi:hypothetical protein
MEINPRKLEGNWDKGWAMDLHTTSSKYIGDVNGKPTFESTYPPISEELNRFKYRNDKDNRVANIAKPMADFIQNNEELSSTDVILSSGDN